MTSLADRIFVGALKIGAQRDECRLGSNPVAPTVFERSPSASTSKGFSVDLQHFSLVKPSSICLDLEKGFVVLLRQRAIRPTLLSVQTGWTVRSLTSSRLEYGRAGRRKNQRLDRRERHVTGAINVGFRPRMPLQ
jgi:hypothetical protein